MQPCGFSGSLPVTH